MSGHPPATLAPPPPAVQSRASPSGRVIHHQATLMASPQTTGLNVQLHAPHSIHPHDAYARGRAPQDTASLRRPQAQRNDTGEGYRAHKQHMAAHLSYHIISYWPRSHPERRCASGTPHPFSSLLLPPCVPPSRSRPTSQGHKANNLPLDPALPRPTAASAAPCQSLGQPKNTSLRRIGRTLSCHCAVLPPDFRAAVEIPRAGVSWARQC